MNGNGELTETENVIFYVSYGVLTEFLRMNVILTYFATENGNTATEERKRNAGNHVRAMFMASDGRQCLLCTGA